MRRGVGAEFLQSQVHGSAHRAPFASGTAGAPSALQYASSNSAHLNNNRENYSQTRANIARLFCDLRASLRMTPHQVAAQLHIPVETIAALESGQFEYLPPGPQTAHVIMAYAAMAGLDGRPVLSAIVEVLGANASAQPEAVGHAPQSRVKSGKHHFSGHHLPVERLRQAGSALANGAKRLPAGAIKQVRERPERAFYAVSLPLGVVLLLLNTSALQAAFGHVPRPVSQMAQTVRQFFQEQFAPVREGLRWIEVDDPRRRRGDKLR